jgi:hypothetical protein
VSVDAAQANRGGAQLPAGVAAALAAAEIPPSKLGPARRARLTQPERALYFWILRRFATDGRPSSAEIRTESARLRVDVEVALAMFAREDLVHLGGDGEITVAYPFSGDPDRASRSLPEWPRDVCDVRDRRARDRGDVRSAD